MAGLDPAIHAAPRALRLAVCGVLVAALSTSCAGGTAWMPGTSPGMTMEMVGSATETTIVFDTDCVLCSGMVAFVLAHEADHALRFAGAWSPEGLALAARHGMTREDLGRTFLVVRDGAPLTRSDGAIAIARHLRAPWRLLAAARIVPAPVRNAAYDLVAKRRYRWFGRRDDCTVVPPGQRGRFVGVKA